MTHASGSSTDITIAGGASSARPAGDDAAVCDRPGSGKSGPAQPPPPVPGHDLVSIHVSPAVSVVLVALAAERGVSVTRMIAILAVDAAEKVGIAALVREVRDDG